MGLEIVNFLREIMFKCLSNINLWNQTFSTKLEQSNVIALTNYACLESYLTNFITGLDKGLVRKLE
jgi:hypothetical protein